LTLVPAASAKVHLISKRHVEVIQSLFSVVPSARSAQCSASGHVKQSKTGYW